MRAPGGSGATWRSRGPAHPTWMDPAWGPRTPLLVPAAPAPCQVRPCSRTLTFQRPGGAAPAGQDGCRQQQRQQQRQRRPGRPGWAAARDPHERRGSCGQRRRRAGERDGGSRRCVRAPCPLRSDTPGPAPPGPRAPASFSHGPPRPGLGGAGAVPPLPAPSFPLPGSRVRGARPQWPEGGCQPSLAGATLCPLRSPGCSPPGASCSACLQCPTT